MKRRTLLTTAASAAIPFARPHAQRPGTVREWYRFDHASASPAQLAADLEKTNPGIRIQGESIAWCGDADDDAWLDSSIIANNAPACAPDCAPDRAVLKIADRPCLLEIDASLALDKWIEAWPGRSDISDDLWRLHKVSATS